MPLLVSALTTGLPGAAGADYPATRAAAALAWSNAVQAWAAGVLPASTTVTAAAATLRTQLEVAFASSAAAPLLESAFAAFALTVGGGMVGYVPTPPPAPVGFATLFAGPKPSSRQAGIDAVASAIDTWMRTGIAVNLAGVVPWT